MKKININRVKINPKIPSIANPAVVSAMMENPKATADTQPGTERLEAVTAGVSSSFRTIPSFKGNTVPSSVLKLRF